MTWGRFIIDAVFMRGDKHSNHEDTAIKMIQHVVHRIRTHCDKDVPIIIRMDSGFCDQMLMRAIEALGVGYICGAHFLPEIKAFVEALTAQAFQRHFGRGDENIWEFFEFGDRRGAWKTFRRAIFWRPFLEDKQFLLPWARPSTLFYTNLGMGSLVDKQLKKAGLSHMIQTEGVISTYHDRGSDELVHRSFKDFGFEGLSFLRFDPITAFYYSMLVAFFPFEAFKENVTATVVPVTAFLVTLRRKLVDVAAKIATHAGRTILKLSRGPWIPFVSKSSGSAA